MNAWRQFCRQRLWLLAAAFMVGLTATDTVVHWRSLELVTAEHLSATSMPDSSSPTGYAWGQRDRIFPYVGMDGYHWVLQTQQMFAEGGTRVREVNYDNPPNGREVHWSSSYRWWIAALAWLDHFYTGTPLPYAVENVMMCASTVLILLILLGMLFAVAPRLGNIPTALLAVGVVSISPIYVSFSQGKSDHHGLTVVFAMLTVLLLVCGGAGWVRTADIGEKPKGKDKPDLSNWFLPRAAARRWFIASGIAGGMGLWVSAATQAPVLAETGLGALLAAGWLARGRDRNEDLQPDPTLWRVWGVSGAVTSIFFYLLEYFPSHFGWRLEVNHPLYALAWAAGGEIICRMGRWLAGEKPAPRDFPWLGLCAAGVLAAPLVATLFAKETFFVADKFLFNFHEDYIAEFKSMARYVGAGDLDWLQRVEVINALMLLALPLIMWIWRPVTAAILAALTAGVVVVSFIARLPLSTPEFGWLFLGLAVDTVLVGILAWNIQKTPFSRPAKALLALVLLPALFTYFLSLRHMRWMEISYALWLVALAAVAAVLIRRGGMRWTFGMAAGVVVFLASALAIAPIHLVQQWRSWKWTSPPTSIELMELITRDVAQRLRLREGAKVGVVVSGPTTTTWMIYWGGFKGVGTLYWENLAGLKATADLYAADSDATARELVEKYGVTHFVIFPWDEFAVPYARLKNNLRLDTDPPASAFVLRLMRGGEAPRWLRPYFYPMPPMLNMDRRGLRIWEVVPEQTEAEARLRQAQWEMGVENYQRAFDLLSGILKSRPYDLATLAALGRLAGLAKEPKLLDEVVQRARANLSDARNLSLGDRIDLATVFHLGKSSPELQSEIAACADMATSASLRRLEPEQIFNLLSLTSQLGMMYRRPGLWNYGLTLLTPEMRAHLLAEAGQAQLAAREPARAVEYFRRAVAADPQSLPALNGLAWILCTSPSSSLRNGREALAFAHRANELDKNAHVDVRDTLACAYAECGEYETALSLVQSCIKTAEQNNAAELAARYREQAALFRKGQPYRVPEQ